LVSAESSRATPSHVWCHAVTNGVGYFENAHHFRTLPLDEVSVQL
jgi:hypothetical protein